MVKPINPAAEADITGVHYLPHYSVMILLAPEDREFVKFQWVDDLWNNAPELRVFRYTGVALAFP